MRSLLLKGGNLTSQRKWTRRGSYLFYLNNTWDLGSPVIRNCNARSFEEIKASAYKTGFFTMYPEVFLF